MPGKNCLTMSSDIVASITVVGASQLS